MFVRPDLSALDRIWAGKLQDITHKTVSSLEDWERFRTAQSRDLWCSVGVSRFVALTVFAGIIGYRVLGAHGRKKYCTQIDKFYMHAPAES